MKDIREQVLAAFQIEHKDHITGIRTLLEDATAPENGLDPPQLDEAFRLAHSLKGGARVCDLQPTEELAHHLESLFSAVRKGELEWRPDVTQIVNRTIDAIEVWMEALGDQQPLPETASTLRAIDGLLRSAGNGPARSDTAATEGETVPDNGLRGGKPAQTVRIDAGSLDRLFHHSGQLLHDLSLYDDVDAALGDFKAGLSSMRRGHDEIRRLASTKVYRHDDTPHLRAQLGNCLSTIDRQLDGLIRRVDALRRSQHHHQWKLHRRGRQIYEEARTAQMIPVESIVLGFRRMVRDLCDAQNKSVELTLHGVDQRADRRILQSLRDPLMHVLRNAVVHGIEPKAQRLQQGKPATGAVELAVTATAKSLQIVISDDGRGIDWDVVRRQAAQQGFLADSDLVLDDQALTGVLFSPGFTTASMASELAGRGMGLSVLNAVVTRLRGDVHLQSEPGRGTRLELSIPISLSTHRVLLVRVADQTFGVPIRSVERLLRIRSSDIVHLEGSPFVSHHDRPVPLVSLAQVLSLDAAPPGASRSDLSVVVMKSGTQVCAVVVDGFLSERNALFHELTGPAAAATHFSAAVLLNHGELALVVDTEEFLKKLRHRPFPDATPCSTPLIEAAPPDVLIVDDSFTTRTLEKSILEAHGYHVHAAVDGESAFVLLKSRRIDLVICDVEMPRMDGFELLSRVRADPQLSRLPFLLVTSRDNVEDRDTGLTLGADAYILKQKFDHQALLETIRRFL